MNIYELPHLAADLLERCMRENLSYGDAMKLLIATAGMAAEMETVASNKCQQQEFTEACNFTLREYIEYSDDSKSKQNAPSTGTIN